MERGEAVYLLANRAAELRLDMKLSNEGVLPPEILLALAYEEAILRRFNVAYTNAPEDVRKKVDLAKARCGAQSGYAPLSEGWIRYVDRIVKGDYAPAAVVEIKCDSCKQGRPVVDILSNMAGARPLWTFYIDADMTRHT